MTQFNCISGQHVNGLAQLGQANMIIRAAYSEANSYDNRQVALRTSAAGFAVVSLTPAAVVTAPASIALTAVALTDTLITKGKFDAIDTALTVVSLIPAGKVVAEAVQIHEAEEAVKAGQEMLHVGASVLGAELAVGEKKEAEAAADEAHREHHEEQPGRPRLQPFNTVPWRQDPVDYYDRENGIGRVAPY